MNCVALQDIADRETIPHDELMKAGIFDLLALNTDRHLGNLLVSQQAIVLIDHGGCFPELRGLKEITFDWMHLPFAGAALSPSWRAFIQEIDFKKVLKSLIDSMLKLDQKFPHNLLGAPNQALLVSIHAYLLLKAWADLKPQLSLIDFARGYVRESLPILHGMPQKIALPPNTDIHNFDYTAFCESHDIDPTKYYLTIQRKTVGGHFIKVIQKSCEELTKMMIRSSPRKNSHWLIDNFDKIVAHASQYINGSLLKTTQELLSQ